jgi:hypothetical protein
MGGQFSRILQVNALMINLTLSIPCLVELEHLNTRKAAKRFKLFYETCFFLYRHFDTSAEFSKWSIKNGA